MKIWFVPVIILGIMIGIWNVNPAPKLVSISPIEKNKSFQERMVDKSSQLRSAPKSDVIVNGVIGGVLGWVITKSLDSLVMIIRRRRKTDD